MTDRYAIEGEWLVELSDDCTCAAAGLAVSGHERSCGMEPIGPVDDLLRAAVTLERLRTTGTTATECDGRCLTGSDVGIPGNGIAYPDPECSLHGPDAARHRRADQVPVTVVDDWAF